MVSHGLRSRRYGPWVLLVSPDDLLGDTRIVSHGLPLCATPFLTFNSSTGPVNKQHFHGTLRTLLLQFCMGLTRNHHHDCAGRGPSEKGKRRGLTKLPPHSLHFLLCH